MTDRRDDDFRLRPGAPKSRDKGFVSKVLKQVGKAGGKLNEPPERQDTVSPLR